MRRVKGEAKRETAPRQKARSATARLFARGLEGKERKADHGQRRGAPPVPSLFRAYAPVQKSFLHF